MKTRNLNIKNKTLALGLLASVLTAGTAFADGYHHANRTRGPDVNGTVVVSKEIPGGVITVGATIGRERPVVVEKVVVVKEQPQKVVIIKEQPQKVVIIKERPVEKVVIVKERPVEKVVVVKERRNGRIVEKRIVTRGKGRGHDHHDHDRWDRNDRNDRRDGHRDWDRDGRHDHGDRHDRDFSHGKQVSVQKQGPDGNYHYYEDAHQVSIQDNRGGVNRHVYVQK